MSAKSNNSAEYVNDDVEETDCEYVYEQESRNKTKDSIKKLSQENRKDRHKTSESGLYDELDYELNPRDENFIKRNVSMDNASILNGSKSQNRTLKQKKIIVPVTILIVCMVGGVAALLLLVPKGKNILCFNYTTAQQVKYFISSLQLFNAHIFFF